MYMYIFYTCTCMYCIYMYKAYVRVISLGSLPWVYHARARSHNVGRQTSDDSTCCMAYAFVEALKRMHLLLVRSLSQRSQLVWLTWPMKKRNYSRVNNNSVIVWLSVLLACNAWIPQSLACLLPHLFRSSSSAPVSPSLSSSSYSFSYSDSYSCACLKRSSAILLRHRAVCLKHRSLQSCPSHSPLLLPHTPLVSRKVGFWMCTVYHFKTHVSAIAQVW